MSEHVFQVYQELLKTLNRQVGELFDEYREQVSCRKGCSSCCINGFKIRYIEGLNLIQGFVQAPAQVQEQILDNLADKNQASCPVLVDGACALYENRPSLCRAYGLILQVDDKIATCKLNFNDPPEAMPLKTLDMRPYYDLLDELSQDAWRVMPLETLANTPDAPRDSIRAFFEAFVRLHQASVNDTVQRAS